MFYKISNQFASWFGYELCPVNHKAKIEYPPDFTIEEIATWEAVNSYTMTSPERIITLIRAIDYIVWNKISGCILECGVWKGGSMMAVACTLKRLNEANRNLYLFDTFDGMPAPTEHDYTSEYNKTAAELLANGYPETSSIWAKCAKEVVRKNMELTEYPVHLIKYVQGRVEDTIPLEVPNQIALLRLDTDWYESTKHEMENLYPRLVSGGILIVDDYGHWAGARKAVDEYLKIHHIPLFLHRIDYTGRIAVKP